MKFHEISEFCMGEFVLELNVSGDFTLSNNEFVKLSINKMKDDTDKVLIESIKEKEQFTYATFLTESDKNSLQNMLNTPYFAIISNKYKDAVEISIVSYLHSDIAKFALMLEDNSVKFEDEIKSIKNKYFFTDGVNEYFIVGRKRQAYNKGFIMVRNGSYRSVDLDRKTTRIDNSSSRSDDVYIVKKEKPISNLSEYEYSIAKAEIEFCESPEKAALKAEAIAWVNSGRERYIKAWEKYIDEENNYYIDKATQAGKLDFVKCIQIDKQGITYKAEIVDRGNFDNFVRVMDETRNYSVEIFGLEKVVFDVRNVLREEKTFILKICGSKKVKDKIPEEGSFYYSVSGHNTMYERRNAALESITSGKSGMPNLINIISGEINLQNSNNEKHYEPLSNNIVEEVFGGRQPNDAQINAIDIAINTPDIAVIEGPPGTGKTTVIAAIVKRIEEISKNKKIEYGKHLMTAFQNDATANMTDKTKVYGLPIERFESNYAFESDDDNDRDVSESVDRWIEEKKYQIEKKYPQIKKNILSEAVKNICLSYDVSSYTYSMNYSVIKNLLDKHSDDMSAEDLHQLEELLNKAESKINEKEKYLEFYLAKKIPESKESFSDDGENLFFAIKFKLELLCNEKIKTMLNSLSELYRKDDIDFKKVSRIKNLILFELIPNNEIIIPVEFNNVLKDLLERMSYLTSINDEEQVVYDYLKVFRENPIEVRNAIKRYMSVVGATHQYSDSNNVKKELRHDFFDVVYIDEAARSSPPDLLIPMSKAQEKIILVGDYRQLPQFKNDLIIKQIINNERDVLSKEEYEQYYKETMFKHLIDVSGLLQKKDGKKRTIMLDTQYRMHESLGEFVSRNFYDGKLKSPICDASLTFPKLEGLDELEGKCLCWLDVKNGNEEHNSVYSYYRESEVDVISEYVKKIIKADKEKTLSIGIISFYKEQVTLIEKKLSSDDGILYCKDEKYQVKKEYDFDVIKNGVHRVTVGTVDAFQGLEFDIVFLSMTRSNNKKIRTTKDYGHLTVKNRLCVATSRQKKCLFVVGNSDMVRSDDEVAIKAVEALVDFCAIANGGGKHGYEYGKFISCD